MLHYVVRTVGVVLRTSARALRSLGEERTDESFMSSSIAGSTVGTVVGSSGGRAAYGFLSICCLGSAAETVHHIQETSFMLKKTFLGSWTVGEYRYGRYAEM